MSDIPTNKLKSQISQSHLSILERQYPDIVGTVMAFDFGEKRIGVAVGETILKAAHPVSTIEAETNDIKFAKIADISKYLAQSRCYCSYLSYRNGDFELNFGKFSIKVSKSLEKISESWRILDNKNRSHHIY